MKHVTTKTKKMEMDALQSAKLKMAGLVVDFLQIVGNNNCLVLQF